MLEKSALKRVNRFVYVVNMVNLMFAVVGHIMGIVRGEYQGVPVILFVIMCLYQGSALTVALRFIGDKILYRKISSLSFLAFYGFLLFFSHIPVIYIIIFPMLAVFLLYNDTRFILKGLVAVVLVTLVNAFYDLVILDIPVNDGLFYKLYSIISFSFLVMFTTRINASFAIDRIDEINGEKEKQASLLDAVLSVATVLRTNSNEVYNIVDEIQTTTIQVNETIEDITNDTVTNVNNIDSQLHLTKDIQTNIEEVSVLSEEMMQLSKETTGNIHQGIEVVKKLENHSKAVSEKNSEVVTAINHLSEKSNSITDIISVIRSISEQTNLLALNASIESARAGEAGKGFAVVAEEIRKLAEQSKESTDDIAHIIEELQGDVKQSLQGVEALEVVSKEQNNMINTTGEMFGNINKQVTSVNDSVVDVSGKIEGILESNNHIVTNLNELSENSEQTMAGTEELNAITNENLVQVERSKKFVTELINTAKDLDQYVK